MKLKQRLMAVLTAGAMALALSACSSGDTAADTSNEAGNSQSSAAPNGDQAPTDLGSAATQDDSTAPEDSAGSDDSAVPENSGAPTADTDAGSGEGASPQGAVTLSGDLGTNGEAWFSEMCGGMTPVLTAMMGAMSAGAADESADPGAIQKQVVSQFTSAADSLTDTGKKLADMPAPSINDGDQFAAAVSAGFGTMAEAIRSLADQVGAAHISTMDDLSDALGAASSSIGDDMDMLDNFVPDADLQAQIKQIPACASLSSMGAFGE